MADYAAGHAADYAAGHAAASVRPLLRPGGSSAGTSWQAAAWPPNRSKASKDCFGPIGRPKALAFEQLERIAQAAGSIDPRARDPWPERDTALFAVFAGAEVRIGEAIA